MAQSFQVEGVSLAVNTSIGTAFYPGEAVTPNALLELADRRMFNDKEQGRGA